MAKGGYYDKNKDYSLAIKNAQASGASASTIKQLQNERQNKIDSQYGGNDPYKGSSNLMGGSGTSVSGNQKTTTSASSGGNRSSLGTIGGLMAGIGALTGSALNAWNNRNNLSGSSSGGGTTTAPGNTDYHQQAIDAAMAGDYEGMMAALNQRQDKINSQGGNDRGTSNWQILQELTSKYFPNGQPQKLEEPTFDFSLAGETSNVISNLLNSNLADWKESDQYAALKKQYANNGEMSMNDLMGQVAARTGGLASSYAAQVGGQTYNDYMAKLEQAAQEMYQQSRSDQLDNLNALQQIYNNEYGAYQDALNQYNTNRNFEYQQQQDALNRTYQQEQDKLANDWKEKEWNYGLTQDEWNKAASQAETLAQYGDFSGYKALGYTDAQIADMKKQWDIAQALEAQKSKSSGSKSGSSSGSGSGSQDADALFRAAYASGNPNSFIANNYKKYGFNSSSGLTADYADWVEEAEATPVKSGLEMNSSSFNAFGKSIAAQLAAGKISAAVSNIDANWDSLSKDQQSQITALLKRYGYNYNP